LAEHCFLVAKVLWIVVRMLQDGCLDIANWLLGCWFECSWWF